jgi:hypothetical protein
MCIHAGRGFVTAEIGPRRTQRNAEDCTAIPDDG